MLHKLKENLPTIEILLGCIMYLYFVVESTLSIAILWLILIVYLWLLTSLVLHQYKLNTFINILCVLGILISITLFFKIGVEQISGPVGITYVIGETTKFGLIPTLGLIGMISASIGVLNLLPIPMLDGGHLLSYLLEIILGRRIVNKLNKPMTVLGFAIIATLFSIGFMNDIDKIFL